MMKNYAVETVRRSRLIMPVTQKKYVEKAYLRNADSVVLDLEDSVPFSEKLAARTLVAEGIALVGRGGGAVGVRVNHTPELLQGDLEAAVVPGLDFIMLPKAETVEGLLSVEAAIGKLEAARGMVPGQITINVVVENPVGYLNAERMAAASARMDALTLGNEDFCREIGMRWAPELEPAMTPLRMQMLVVARAFGKIPLGLFGSMTKFTAKEEFAALAGLSFQSGFLGSTCIHPDNVETLNACFSPTEESAAEARELAAALEAAMATGKSAAAFKGRMIDVPHYEQAKALIARAELIQKFEARKQKARQAAQ